VEVVPPEDVRVPAEPAPRPGRPLRRGTVEDGGGTPAGQASEAPSPSVDHATWRTSDPLPQAPRALIDPAKFTHYAMDPNHPRNGGKWKAFEALGYDVRSEAGRQRAAQDVINQLRKQLVTTAATENKTTQYGRRFQVRAPIIGLNGEEGTLVTIWQFDVGSDVPRLVTHWLEVHD
jgi:hypothetical protein